MDSNHLPNNDEGGIINSITTTAANNNKEKQKKKVNVSDESRKEQQRRLLLLQSEADQLEERLHNVHHLSVEQDKHDNNNRGREIRAIFIPKDAIAVTAKVHYFLQLRNDDDQQQRGEDQWFLRSQAFSLSTKQWIKRLSFFELCFSLKRNSPSFRKVEIEANDADNAAVFRDGRLRYLGNALLHNTSVTELVVDVAIMRYEKNDIKRASMLLEFIRTSAELRKVGICQSELKSVPSGNHLAGLILDAMASNASIQELDIADSYPVKSFHKLMSTTTSLKVLHIDCEDFHSIWDDNHRNRLLQALATNCSIDSLSFTVYGSKGSVWLEKIPQYVSSGPVKVQKLLLKECLQLPPQVLDLMETTSLQTLEMRFDLYLSVNYEHLSLLQETLANNNSIENLKLVGDDQKIVYNILLHLHNGPSTLRTLTLKSYEDDFDALRQYLCLTTAMLQHLVLEECLLMDTQINCLTDGLQALDSSQSTAMTQVTLKSCQLIQASIKGLAAFVAGRCKHHNGQHRLALGLLLLSNGTTLVSPPEMKGTINIEDLMDISMSTTLLSSASSGITSDHPGSTHCTSLSMRPSRNIPAYSDALMATVEGPPFVVCLQLSCVGPRDSFKLAVCLPRLMSLSALHLVDIQDNVLPATILNGLQRNGSLLVTSFWKAGRRRFFQDVHDRNVAQSYCHRNRVLSETILRKTALRDICTVNVLPTLFRVANAIPLFKTPFVLAALLELDGTIGPQPPVVASGGDTVTTNVQQTLD